MGSYRKLKRSQDTLTKESLGKYFHPFYIVKPILDQPKFCEILALNSLFTAAIRAHPSLDHVPLLRNSRTEKSTMLGKITLHETFVLAIGSKVKIGAQSR